MFSDYMERNPQLFRLEAGLPSLGFAIKVFKMLNDPEKVCF